jgi:hypothetical protein
MKKVRSGTVELALDWMLRPDAKGLHRLFAACAISFKRLRWRDLPPENVG